MLSDWQYRGEGSWSLATKKREDEERETVLDKGAKVHSTLVCFAIGLGDLYLDHTLYLVGLLS